MKLLFSIGVKHYIHIDLCHKNTPNCLVLRNARNLFKASLITMAPFLIETVPIAAKRQVDLLVAPFMLVPNILPTVDVDGMVKGNGMTSSSSCDDKQCIRKECIADKCIKQRCDLNMENCVPFTPEQYLN